MITVVIYCMPGFSKYIIISKEAKFFTIYIQNKFIKMCVMLLILQQKTLIDLFLLNLYLSINSVKDSK